MPVYFLFEPSALSELSIGHDRAKTKTKGWRGSREAWLSVAKDILIDQGESAVTVQAMAKRLKLSRTSFYWFFRIVRM